MTFLTPTELVELTGYRRRSKQIEWLRSRRLRFWINGLGHPVVSRAMLLGENVVSLPQGPNLSALKERA